MNGNEVRCEVHTNRGRISSSNSESSLPDSNSEADGVEYVNYSAIRAALGLTVTRGNDLEAKDPKKVNLLTKSGDCKQGSRNSPEEFFFHFYHEL